ncbi:murein L,D-transpeptidase YcbB/YkuD [Rhodoligotrophos appendicifer]|uniref:L,D-transpeptidase family protein n=1 Tax=Rhodoligotrophos appendicifer TaxID=987056 RepID=UPI0011862C2C|nr:L,D-transpeptidase family protein [Rhodoligotrophos appendicifer]
MSSATRRLSWMPQIIVVALLFCAPQSLRAEITNDAVAAELRQIIVSDTKTIGTDDGDERLFGVYTYYEERDFKPLWVRDNGTKAKAKDFLDIIRAAEEDGLDPNNYRANEIAARIDAQDPRSLAELDLLLSRSFIDYGNDISVGRVIPDQVGTDIHIKPKGPGPLTLLDGVEQAEDMGPYVDSLAPASANYARLKEALMLYRDIEARGGWPSLPEGPTMKPGTVDARTPLLRRLLIATADLSASAPDMNELYDGAVVEGVKLFQERHGLTADGVIGPGTLEALNVPVEERIRQLVLNMERRRWMPDDTGKYYVFVNLADQYLKIVDDDRTVHDAKLVVGKPFSRTPIFTQKMSYIVFNPYWNVPTSIAVNEYLPKLKANPAALAAQNFEVVRGETEISPYSVSWANYGRGNFPFVLRQKPGPKNALGRLKFMFPNPYNIYIHDTPAKSLFDRDNRFFSHGCMRVQNPEELAKVILSHDDPSWTMERIEQELKVNRNKAVRLKKAIPVYVTYLTAWANKDRAVNFRKDVYGRDQELLVALRKVGDVVN